MAVFHLRNMRRVILADFFYQWHQHQQLKFFQMIRNKTRILQHLSVFVYTNQRYYGFPNLKSAQKNTLLVSSSLVEEDGMIIPSLLLGSVLQ